MGMAEHWRLIPSAQGLLLCVLALHLCVQDPLATAEHNTAINTSVAPTNASVAPTNASVAPTNASVAPTNASVAPTNASVAPTNASVAPTNASVAPTNASVAPINASVAPTNASVAPTNASVAPINASVAPINASVAPINASVAPKASVVVPNTTVAPNALVVPTNALVVPKTSVVPKSSAVPKALVAAANTSVVPKASVAPSISVVPNALVATNASVNGTEAMKLTCQSFQCSGERCYQDGAHANETVTCRNETYCELYRFSSTNYTARCSSACGSGMCRTNSSVSTRECALDCCNSSLCLQLNASSYGDRPPATTPPMTTTSRAPQNGKVCAAFSCHGDGCFKGRKAVARCSAGQDFCEMKKMGLNYMAGCSKACKAAKPVCAAGTKAACYQECCPATLRASCLKLDGKVHISGAARVTAAPLWELLACGMVLLLTCRGSASLWG